MEFEPSHKNGKNFNFWLCYILYAILLSGLQLPRMHSHTHTHNISYVEFLYLCSPTRARPTTHSLILSWYVAKKKKNVIKEEVMKALKQIIGVGGQTGVYSCAYLDISQGTKTAREMNWPAARRFDKIESKVLYSRFG